MREYKIVKKLRYMVFFCICIQFMEYQYEMKMKIRDKISEIIRILENNNTDNNMYDMKIAINE